MIKQRGSQLGCFRISRRGPVCEKVVQQSWSVLDYKRGELAFIFTLKTYVALSVNRPFVLQFQVQAFMFKVLLLFLTSKVC